MSNLGAIKLRRWRHRLTVCPEAGREARVITQAEVGERIGVTKAMINKLEDGTRKPSRTAANRLSEMGVCAPEDWDRPSRCGDCARVLGHEPAACGAEGCSWAGGAETEARAA